MCEWSHDLQRSDSWLSLIFGEVREKPPKKTTGPRTLEPT
jgi:hypothetical protein